MNGCPLARSQPGANRTPSLSSQPPQAQGTNRGKVRLGAAGMRACKPLTHKHRRRNAMTQSGLIVNEVLCVRNPNAQRLGLDRLDEDKLILEFARWAEGQLKKWLDYAKGA